MNDEEPYSLDELIKKLEAIRDGKDDQLNYVKAFYTLALHLQDWTDYMAELRGNYEMCPDFCPKAKR